MPAQAVDPTPFMARALELAERGRGRVEPNPLVGAVVVRDGRVVGEGFHERFGGPHAEPNAIAAAGEACRGATLCVTLEAAAQRLNAPFTKRTTRGLPFVIAKWAMSLDGKAATRTGDSRWVSSVPSRE